MVAGFEDHVLNQHAGSARVVALSVVDVVGILLLRREDKMDIATTTARRDAMLLPFATLDVLVVLRFQQL